MNEITYTRLPLSVKERLVRIAERNKITMSHALLLAAHEYIEREEARFSLPSVSPTPPIVVKV